MRRTLLMAVLVAGGVVGAVVPTWLHPANRVPVTLDPSTFIPITTPVTSSAPVLLDMNESAPISEAGTTQTMQDESAETEAEAEAAYANALREEQNIQLRRLADQAAAGNLDRMTRDAEAQQGAADARQAQLFAPDGTSQESLRTLREMEQEQLPISYRNPDDPQLQELEREQLLPPPPTEPY